MRLKTTLLIEQLEWMALNRKYSKIEVSPRTLSRLNFGVPIYPSYAALHQLTRLVSYSRSHIANRCTGKVFPSINSAFKIIQICFLLWRWYFVYSASEQMEVSQGIINTSATHCHTVSSSIPLEECCFYFAKTKLFFFIQLGDMTRLHLMFFILLTSYIG